MAEMGGMTWEAGPGRGGEAEAGPQQSSGGFWDGEWGGGPRKDQPSPGRWFLCLI